MMKMSNISLKLSQNHQRRQLEKLSKELPTNILDLIDTRNFQYQEAINQKHSLPLFPQGNNGKYDFPIGYSTYEYHEVDNIPDLIHKIELYELCFNSDCYIKLSNEAPYIYLNKSNTKQFIEAYINNIKIEYRDLILFQSDYKKGLVIDSYCGYLEIPTENGEKEIVYEVISWAKI